MDGKRSVVGLLALASAASWLRTLGSVPLGRFRSSSPLVFFQGRTLQFGRGGGEIGGATDVCPVRLSRRCQAAPAGRHPIRLSIRLRPGPPGGHVATSGHLPAARRAAAASREDESGQSHCLTMTGQLFPDLPIVRADEPGDEAAFVKLRRIFIIEANLYFGFMLGE